MARRANQRRLDRLQHQAIGRWVELIVWHKRIVERAAMRDAYERHVQASLQRIDAEWSRGDGQLTVAGHRRARTLKRDGPLSGYGRTASSRTDRVLAAAWSGVRATTLARRLRASPVGRYGEIVRALGEIERKFDGGPSGLHLADSASALAHNVHAEILVILAEELAEAAAEAGVEGELDAALAAEVSASKSPHDMTPEERRASLSKLLERCADDEASARHSPDASGSGSAGSG